MRGLYCALQGLFLDKVTLTSQRDRIKFVFQKIILVILWRSEWKGHNWMKEESWVGIPIIRVRDTILSIS